MHQLCHLCKSRELIGNFNNIFGSPLLLPNVELTVQYFAHPLGGFTGLYKVELLLRCIFNISMDAVNNRTEIAEIKRRYDTGEIDRDTAKELAEPILDRIYEKQCAIAKSHGKGKPPKMDFINAMRNSY